MQLCVTRRLGGAFLFIGWLTTSILSADTVPTATPNDNVLNISTNTGVMMLFAPTTINPNGTLTYSGTIEIGGNDINSVVTVNGNLTNSGAVLQTPFINQAGYQTFGAALRVQGTVTNQSTGTLSLSAEPGVLPEEFDVPL